MTDRQKEIDDLLSLFHDFDIVTAELSGDTLVLAISIPWGSMWKKDDYTYTIRLELMGCTYFSCVYYKYQGEPEKIIISTPTDLNGLELSIQSRKNIQPDTYELYCICQESNDSATITIVASNYRIFNQEGIEITLETMKRWAKDWWDEIQKMWDEQKSTTTR